MTDPEYMDLAEGALAAIERCSDRIGDATDADIDCQRVGAMLTLIFGNGSQIVVNLQKPWHEIWLATRSDGYHYRHDGRCWVDTKSGAEFFAMLTREASAQAGQALLFTPD
ncbi:MAG: iron donor protein CyaY [Burkholderiaceae bacterium]|jgi:CyaY protein|nr:iron donor protein CyaY [Burkholderiaceae bacterium]